MSSKQIYPKKKILKENYDTEQKKKKHHRTHKTHVIRDNIHNPLLCSLLIRILK